jgi:hypothetical protein
MLYLPRAGEIEEIAGLHTLRVRGADRSVIENRLDPISRPHLRQEQRFIRQSIAI